MLRALWLSSGVFLLFSASVSAEAPRNSGANAALKYWQAFATMPKFSDAEQTKLVAECMTMPLDDHAKDIVTKSAYALRMMHQGAALPRSDWAIGWEEEGIDALLPQMTAARVLSSIACLRARLRFEEGRPAEAIDDLVDAMTLSRHTSPDGSLIGVLVGYSIESHLGEEIAHYLPKLNNEMLMDLKKRLEALPAGGQPATALLVCEEKSFDWFMRKVKAAKDKEALLALLSFLEVSEGKDRDAKDKRGAFLAECGGAKEGILKFAEEARPSYARVAKMLDLPLEQFDKAFEAETKKQSANPVFKTFFPAVAKVRLAKARADVRHTLLATAIAIQLNGKDDLKNHQDPVVGGTFEYAAADGGFELRSKFKGQNDKPLTLKVGSPAK